MVVMTLMASPHGGGFPLAAPPTCRPALRPPTVGAARRGSWEAAGGPECSDAARPLEYIYIEGIHQTLLSKATYKGLTTKYICQKEGETLYFCRYSKDVHRNKCQTLTMARLTHSLYTTKIARIRC